MVEILCHSCPKTKLRNTRIIPKILTKFKHVFLTMFASKSDSTRISFENFVSKYHPNFASEYRKKCGPHSTRFQCRRHYVADIFCQKMSPKMSPTFKKCRRHLHRHFRRNYQNIGWVHRCLLSTIFCKQVNWLMCCVHHQCPNKKNVLNVWAPFCYTSGFHFVNNSCAILLLW